MRSIKIRTYPGANFTRKTEKSIKIDSKVRPFLSTKPELYTKSVRNFVKLECEDFQRFFPTYNGKDPLDEIECIDGKWSLPDDMGPIKCQALSCPWPPIPGSGKEIWNMCLIRDPICMTSKPKNEKDCFCHTALTEAGFLSDPSSLLEADTDQSENELIGSI